MLLPTRQLHHSGFYLLMDVMNAKVCSYECCYLNRPVSVAACFTVVVACFTAAHLNFEIKYDWCDWKTALGPSLG